MDKLKIILIRELIDDELIYMVKVDDTLVGYGKDQLNLITFFQEMCGSSKSELIELKHLLGN